METTEDVPPNRHLRPRKAAKKEVPEEEAVSTELQMFVSYHDIMNHLNLITIKILSLVRYA